MLFTSAAFLFIFLPIALVAYTLTPEKHRKWTLLALCFAFYILANIKTPFAIFFFALAVALFFIAGRYASGSRGRTVCVVTVAVGLSLFAALRMIYEYYDASFIYPLGTAVFLLSGISYVFDIYRGDAAENDIAVSLIYITFFPTIIAGPVIKYKDFLKIFSNRLHTLDRFSAGARRFALGIFERAAIASVLIEAYRKINDMSASSLNFFLALTAAFFLFWAVTLAFAGWIDMACGLSLMLGMDIGYDAKGASFVCNVKSYFVRIFRGVWEWIEDYLVNPAISYMSGEDERLKGALRDAAVFLLTAVWIRTTLSSFLVGLLAAAVIFITELSNTDRFINKYRWARPLGWIFMFAAVCIFWSAATFPSPAKMIDILASLTFSGVGDSTYRVFISISGGKYLFTAAAAVVLSVVTVFGGKFLPRFSPRARTAIDVVGSLLTVLVFVVTLIYFLPRLPQYATEAFEYFVF